MLLGSMSSYKWNSHYGALITAPVPFNLIPFLFAPLFIVIKDANTLRKMNWFFAIIGYLPIALLLNVLYISANFAMLPFAYLAALAKKI